MSQDSIVILGGYGNAGRAIARLLLEQPQAALVLAGPNADRARSVASELGQGHEEGRVSGVRADASDQEGLTKAFRGARLVVVASSTARYTREVAEAALAAGTDYLDIQVSRQKLDTLRTLAQRIEDSGRLFITDAGFHPGLPAALVRYMVPLFEEMHTAVVSSVLRQDWRLQFSPATAPEFVQEFVGHAPEEFVDGQWRRSKGWPMRTSDFGTPFGKQTCALMPMAEMRDLPKAIPTLGETGFYVAGFHWLVNYLVIPIVMAGLKLSPQRAPEPMGRLLLWSLRRTSRPPFGLQLVAEATGVNLGRQTSATASLFAEDGYHLTALPVVACLQQYLAGAGSRAGLHLMAHWVDPEQLVKDLKRMGLQVAVKGKVGASTGGSLGR
ncbi:MAG TPA: saccharopine dehydrogenase NADP-binding domain-containing protein [Armatimonadota bacterium]